MGQCMNSQAVLEEETGVNESSMQPPATKSDVQCVVTANATAEVHDVRYVRPFGQ